MNPAEGAVRSPPTGLRSWARQPGPAAVLDAVRERAARGHGTERGVARCSLSGPERKQVGRLLGVDWELSGGPVRLERLAAALAQHGLSVRELAEAVGGPVADRRAQRAEAVAAAAAELDEVRAAFVSAGVPADGVTGWLQGPGLPHPGGGELSALTREVLAVWRALPGPGGSPVRLARLAAAIRSDDAHALDADRLLGRAVARLAAAVHLLERPRGQGRAWRRAWGAVGVLCDEVSSRVLVLNLPLRGDGPAAALTAAAPGEPVWLTLRCLAGSWTAKPARVYVCENPTVVEAAADRLGGGCPPMVCTDGVASAATLDLLAGLAAAGCEVLVRADVDPIGFTVVDQVCAVAPQARPWRFDAETYAAGTGAPGGAACSLPELFTRHREPLHEEALLPGLLDDLARGLP